MIVIDTHIWIWWVHGHPDLKDWMRERLLEQESDQIGVSVISCWEIARLVADSKLDLNRSISAWVRNCPGVPGSGID